ncbi:MAG: NADH:flavin oxidoreductase [Novosphingobium sp.]|nr:NADH:flavin oxidoreductase [Novosphingobium sp.]
MAQNPIAGLLTPFHLRNLDLENRVVMAPMTRYFSPGGVPGDDVAAYYARRAEGGVGLVITEGVFIPHPAAGFAETIPVLDGEPALAGWRKVTHAVHQHGSKIAAQLWHIGSQFLPGGSEGHEAEHVSASGLAGPGQPIGRALGHDEIEGMVDAYARAAENARACGFDAIELHAAHGYLIDGFFWAGSNQRTDEYGGSLAARTKFGADVVRECRARCGPDFPIIMRYSQWKNADYDARLAETPQELEAFLGPLVDAGVDVFDCSTRCFWEPAFAEGEMGLAGWTKKLSGKPVITVGSVGLTTDLFGSLGDDGAKVAANIAQLMAMFERGDFDLVAIGRMLITHPDWIAKVSQGEHDSLAPFSKDQLETLY